MRARVGLLLPVLVSGCFSPDGTVTDDAGSPPSCSFNCQDAFVDLPLVIKMRGLLGQTCAGAECHSMGAGTFAISGEAGSEFSSLIDVTSTEMPSLLRIKPGDPAQSYAFLKVACDGGIVGTCMPPGAPLSPALVRAFHDWIEGGAPTQ